MLKYILALFLMILPVMAQADTALPLNDFAKLPILHDGRVKPLDSFARIELSRFLKKDTIDGAPAIHWLADTLFNPADATAAKIFLVSNANTRHALGLEDRKKPVYSFAELSSGLEKTTPMVRDVMSIPPKDQTPDQKDMLALHDNALEYTLILRSFSSVLPLNITLSPKWEKAAGLKENAPVTFSALQKIEPDIQSALRTIIKHKGKDPQKYTVDEQATAMLGWQLQVLGQAGTNNTLFRVIPLNTNENWASPWELINDGKGNPSTATIIKIWGNIAAAWQDGDATLWEKSVTDAAHLQPNPKLFLEATYNEIAPFTPSIFVFAAAMCLAFLYLSLSGIPASSSPASGIPAKAGIHNQKNGFLPAQECKKIPYYLSFALLVLAVFIQGAGLCTRIYLMDRPPVGTLYESLLFVGLISPLISLVLERRLRNGLGLIIGALSGAILGLLSLSMAGEGDTMKMLGAVLNTQFWLSTHVLCITIGYGWCLVTSLMAHIILLGKTTNRLSPDAKTQMIKTLTTLSLFSILFTTVGTILGGIWADQSWGRFWGWDPKENGALLIVLWLIWVIHGKIAGQISENIWLGGMALLSVMVGVAWIGVNLLGVGLHSYGFIEGVFWGLGAFTALEILVIGSLIYVNQQRKISHEN